MAKVIEVQDLTPQAYDGKFGRIIMNRPKDEPLADNENLVYWSKIVDLEKDMDHYVSLLVEKKRPIELVTMERHVKSQEYFIPTEGECVMFFAPAKNPDDPDEHPDPEKIVCLKMQYDGMLGQEPMPITGICSLLEGMMRLCRAPVAEAVAWRRRTSSAELAPASA